MLEYVIGAIIVLMVCYIHVYWIRPIRIIKRYVKEIKARGYSVLQIPYNVFSIDVITNIKKGMKQGDALKVYKQQRSKYDVVVTNILSRPRIQINHPDFLKQFYAVDKHYQYPKSQRGIRLFSRVAGRGLVFSEGEIWHRKRKILNKLFNFDFIKSQAQKIAEVSSGSIKQIQQQSLKGKQNTGEVQYDIIDLTVRIFSNVMLTIFLGGSNKQMINSEPAGQFMKNLMADITNQIFVPINAILGPAFLNLGLTKNHRDVNRRIQIVREWGINFIRKRINEIKSDMEKGIKKDKADDIVEAIMMAQHSENPQDKQFVFSQGQILQQFMVFFLAGTDTTSTFTQNMIYQIAKNQQIQRKVREEIQKHMQTEDYSYENLKNLKYIEMVQKQSNRCFGPGTQLFARVTNKDNYLNGIPIKKDTAVAVMTISNHYNPKYFTKPEEFRPERWQSECDNLPNFVYGGFSAGARTCIGKHLALMQSKIALVKFMKRYSQITLPNNNYKMIFKFSYSAEDFQTKMTINEAFKV